MKLTTALSFDDILLKPADFSHVRSRKDVNTTSVMCGKAYNIPVVASNMDSVYSPKLSQEMLTHGGSACTHRFCSINDNVELFKQGCVGNQKPWVSIGVSYKEMERADALISAGADVVVIDVALGAAIHVVEQFVRCKEKWPNVQWVVGNFATAAQINSFVYHSQCTPDLFKVNIGSGAACLTRVVTGVGLPSVESLIECVSTGFPIIQDGGIKNSGDLCKTLALGAKGAFVGKLFAQTIESGAQFASSRDVHGLSKVDYGQKIYRGSASASSYESQGKTDKHRSPEGDRYVVKVTGSVEDLMNNFNGGLRSCMSYMNAFTIYELAQNAEFMQVTNSGMSESRAHGKN